MHRRADRSSRMPAGALRDGRARNVIVVNTPSVPVVDGLFRFECPRCRQAVSERFYGPCAACRARLKDLLHRGPSAVKAVPSPREPRLHVVPNFVATKDDLAGPDEDFST